MLREYKRLLIATLILIFGGYFIAVFCTIIFPNSTEIPVESYSTQTEREHLYWKDIDVVVTAIDRRHWFASTHWYTVNITVKNDEYGLEKTFEIKGSGAFGCPKEWDYNEGNVISAQMYSWVYDSTGEVTRRDLNKLN